jgi:hypothetical protein
LKPDSVYRHSSNPVRGDAQRHVHRPRRPTRILRRDSTGVSFRESIGFDRLLELDRGLLDHRQRPQWAVNAHQAYLSRPRWRLASCEDARLPWKAVLMLFEGAVDSSDISFASMKLFALRRDTGLLHIGELPGPVLCPFEGAPWLKRLSATTSAIWKEAFLEILEKGIPGSGAKTPATIRRGLVAGRPDGSALADEAARGWYHHLVELLGQNDDPLVGLLARDTQLIRDGLGRFRCLGMSDDLLARIARTKAPVSPNLYNWIREVTGETREYRFKALEQFPREIEAHVLAGVESLNDVIGNSQMELPFPSSTREGIKAGIAAAHIQALRAARINKRVDSGDPASNVLDFCR